MVAELLVAFALCYLAFVEVWGCERITRELGKSEGTACTGTEFRLAGYERRKARGRHFRVFRLRMLAVLIRYRE